ncbi:MAG: DUF4278 domain-containing protein [Acaryochloridaceae cyanobacterium SU_2_1]|nr:DUF4278 domain-containing protein [Acaryochloridaceae cyanobacterium SU_2_1]
MKLSYRGVEYHTSAPPLEITSTETIGCYRGVPYQRHLYKAVASSSFVYTLMYRGVEYRTGSYPEVVVTPDSQPQVVMAPSPETTALPSLAREQDFSLPIFPEALSDVAGLDKVHDAYIRKSLEHRLAVAREKGDETLIQLLEAEEQYQAA